VAQSCITKPGFAIFRPRDAIRKNSARRLKVSGGDNAGIVRPLKARGGQEIRQKVWRGLWHGDWQ
jgi:hypothetical protein